MALTLRSCKAPIANNNLPITPLDSHNPHRYCLGVRSLFSLLLALIILAAFGGLAFFFINISSTAKFERKDQAQEKPTTQLPTF